MNTIKIYLQPLINNVNRIMNPTKGIIFILLIAVQLTQFNCTINGLRPIVNPQITTVIGRNCNLKALYGCVKNFARFLTLDKNELKIILYLKIMLYM